MIRSVRHPLKIGILNLSVILTVLCLACTMAHLGEAAIGRDFSLDRLMLREHVSKALKAASLDVAAVKDGSIETSWEQHEGTEHGILWWRQRWQARTRYFVEITPVYTDPTRSRVQITWETQERPNPNYDWEPTQTGSLDRGRLRAVEIMKGVEALLPGSNPGKEGS